MYVVGLGNPGEKYVNTRHNVGRDFLLYMHDVQVGSSWRTDSLMQARVAEVEMADTSVTFVLPETFMNKSGDTVRFLTEKQAINPSDIIVVYDDIDLPLGTLKISVGRGAGGHNGIASIINASNSKDFIRLRIGIAQTSFWTGNISRPAGGEPMTKYVLGRFTTKEHTTLKKVFDVSQQALVVILKQGVENAMNQFNSK